MARPRTLNYKGGQIKLTNFAPEVADEIQKKLLGEAGPVVAPAAESEEQQEEVGAPVGKALSVIKQGKDWKVLVLEYNLDGQCKVLESISCGDVRFEAYDRFKIEADKLGFT